MRINVAEIKLDAGRNMTVPISVSLDPTELGGEEVRFDQPVTGQAEVWNSGDRLLVRATVSGEATMPCSRCLSSVHVPLMSSFEEEFIEGEVPDEAEDGESAGRQISAYSGDEIDLSESVRENILLELPMKALCSEECRGLCPMCGANRNEGTCACETETNVDPRLAILKNLLHKPDSKSE